ncbi:hypothetical protein SAMN06265348_112130 [Pedobacter westerhofensis]|uniref:Uncharacterized protein n=2 Tax=Pedobacter westerhofensis TaxID=425512 RepID=A0A521FHF2_9SPHI|nr:hypothetical protein SAMN06265348_112130 [Pedobacter westerhofensis]
MPGFCDSFAMKKHSIKTMQYIYEDHYKGKPRKLLVLLLNEGQEYRVFWDADFLGSIKPVRDEDGLLIWRTEYNILKPIAGKIGAYISGSQTIPKQK